MNEKIGQGEQPSKAKDLLIKTAAAVFVIGPSLAFRAYEKVIEKGVGVINKQINKHSNN